MPQISPPEAPPPVRIAVRAAGQAGPASEGTEVWLLTVRDGSGLVCPWNDVAAGAGWALRTDPTDGGRTALVASTAAQLTFTAPGDTELVFLRHRWSGRVRVDITAADAGEGIAPTSRELDLAAAAPERIALRAGDLSTSDEADSNDGSVARRDTHEDAIDADGVFLAACGEAKPTVVGVSCPRWLGVTASTRALFEHVYPFPATTDVHPNEVTETDVDRAARVLAESGAEHVVFSGGDACHLAIARKLKSLRPRVRCDLLWHATYPQFAEDGTWRLFCAWVRAAREGVVSVLATVKAGQERVIGSMGLASALLLNRPPEGGPMAPPELDEAGPGGLRIGLWLSGDVWRKTPHAVLAAMKLLPGSVLHTAGLGKRSVEVAGFLGVPFGLREPAPLAPERLAREMRRTHVTAYVTFAECCPMVPLESLHLGVPCVLGPTSHLFEDEPALFDRLVVPFPERAEIIAAAMERAAAERHEIVSAYAAWLPGYRERCDAALRAFASM